MAEPMMENPLTPNPTIGTHHMKLVHDIKDCLRQLKQEFEDSGGYPINDDSQALHRMCAKLEYLLQSGIKAKSSLLGGKKDYWNYISDCLSSNKSLSDGVRFVKSISELGTSLGRGRAFLRFCLMHQRTADTLQQCVSNVRLTSDWYHPKAFWFDRKLVSELLNALYDLNDLQFDLSPRGYDLDASWPTFARRSFGSSFSWQPPSRATSFSSLSSIPTMDSLQPMSVSPQVHQDPDVVKLQAEVTDSSSKTQEVTHKLEAAEREKLATELQLEQAQKQQEEVASTNEHLGQEVARLRSRVEVLSNKCTEYEVMNDKLTQQLKMKETIWQEKEEMLKVRADDAEKMIKGFRADFENSSPSTTPSERFDLMELRGQVVVQKKKCQAAEINLKSAQMELEAKQRVNTKQLELIDLLDRKLQQQKQKVDYLMTTAEQLVSEKEGQATKLKSASEELIKLSNKYISSEKLQKELRRSNTELKAMLSSLEGKGKQLVGMAKEKVRSYTDQNKKLQDEVDDLKQEKNDRGPGSLGDTIKDLEVVLSKSCSDILEQVSQLVSKENLDKQGQLELTEIQDQLKNLEATKTNISKSLDVSLAKEVEELKNKLEESRQDIKKSTEQITMLQEENKSLIQGQGQDLANSGDLRTELKEKDLELERIKSELGAIRALVLQSVTGSAPQEECSSDGAFPPSNEQLTPTITLLKDMIKTNTPNQSEEMSNKPTAENQSGHKMLPLLEEEADFQDNSTRSKDELKTMVTKLATVNSNLLQALAEKEELIILMETLSLQVTEKDAQIAELMGKLDTFQKVLDEYKQSHDATVTEKNDLEAQVKVTESKMTEMEENFLVLVKGIADLREENEVLTVARVDLQAEVEGLLMDKEELQATVTDLNSTQEANERNFKEIEDLKSKVQSKSVEVEKLLRTSETVESELSLKEKSFKDIMEQKSELQRELATLQQDHGDEKHNLESKIFELENQVDDMQMTAIDCKKVIEDQKDQLSTVHSHLKHLELQLEDELSEKLQVENQAKDFNYSFLTTKSQLENKAAQVEEMLETIDNKNEEIKNYKKEVVQKEEDNNLLKSELEEARNMLKEFQVDIQMDRENILQESGIFRDTAEATTVSVESENIQKTAILVPNVHVENMNLREQILLLVSDKDNLCRKLVDEKSALKDQIEILNKQVEEKNRAFDNLQVQYGNLEQEAETVKQDNDGKKEAIQTLMENMELAKVEMESLRLHVKELGESTEEMKSLQSKIKQLGNDAATGKEEWKRERDSWEKEISALRFQMSAQEMEYQEIIKTLDGKVLEKTDLESQVEHQEALVETLELELHQLREEKDHEADRAVELHRELQKVVKENMILTRELVSTNEVVQSERREVSRLKHSFDEQERHLSTFTHNHQETKILLEGDNNELKKRLIQLLKEKDVLWQRIAKLEHQQRLRNSDVWIDSSRVTQCMACNIEFTIIIRKHHCRMCGRVFCNDCSNNWVLMPHSSKQERVCHTCLMSNSQLESSAAPLLDTSDDLTQSVQIPEKRSSKWSSSDSASIPVYDDDLGLRSAEAIARDTDIDQSTPLSTDPGTLMLDTEGNSEVLDEQKLLSMTDDNKSTATQSSKLPVDSSVTSEEAYDLITEDEVLQSLCEPTPDPNVEVHSTVTEDEVREGGVSCPPDLWIPAGKSYHLPVLLTEVGTVLRWQFSTKPKGISFSLTYRENTYVTSEHQEELIPTCKCNSHKDAVTGDLATRKPGIYTLIFDNTTSRFTSKKLEFSLSMTTGGAYVT